jgi:hypothetical protein
MEGRTTTGQQRLADAIEKAHEALQDAHAALYEVQLATERAENDALAAPVADTLPYQTMRTEISELRPLLVPVARWLQSARRASVAAQSDNSPEARIARGLEPIRAAKRGGTHGA